MSDHLTKTLDDCRTPSLAPGDAARTTSADYPATATGGRYQLLAELARGGMGIIYRATDAVLDREVAVKVLQERFVPQSAVAGRFLDEARITGQLQHPGVPAVHDLGTLPDGRLFLAMKLIKGRTLDQLLTERADPAHDQGRYVAVFEQVCQALAYAHAHGVIHRDLKPANVMVGAFAEVQVMDWGLAKVLGSRPPGAAADPEATTGGTEVRSLRDSDGVLTQAGTVLGTPAFMPPEQAAGAVGKIDTRSDVFGLGGILAVILTGQPPFAATSAETTRVRAAQGKVGDCFARLDACGADPDLVALCKRCLAPEPSERPADAGEVAATVGGLRQAAEERARRAELERAAAQTRAVEERKRRRLVVALAVSLFVLGALGLAGWRWWEGQQQAARRLREADRVETEAAVTELLAQAEERQRLAREDPLSDHWAEALAAARQAEGRLAHSAAGDDMRQRVQALLAELEAEQRDHAMKARLWDIRLQEAEMKGQKTDRAGAALLYAQAFRAYGVDVEKLEPSAAAMRLAHSALCVELAAALDDWAWISEDAALQPRLREIARQADLDPWRTRVRTAVAAKDRLALEELARSPDAAGLPAVTAAMLARTLDEVGAKVEAIRLLGQAQQRFPGDYWINLELGSLHYNSKPPGLDSAVRYYSIALAVRALDARTHMLLANALSAKGMVAEAATEYREAMRLKPDYAAPHYCLGLDLRAAGKFDEAIAEYGAALRLDPKLVHAHVALGNALMNRKKYDEACASFEEAARLDSRDPYALKGLGQARLMKDRFDEAIVYFRDALRIDDDLNDARMNLGTSLVRKGDLDEGLAILREAVRRESSPPLANAMHLNIANAVTLKYGLPASTRTAFQLAILRPKGLAEGYIALGKALMDKQQFEEAVACCNEAVRQNPDSFTAHYSLALAEIKRGRANEAIPSLRAAMRLQPGNYGSYYSLGVVLSKQGKWAEAVPFFRTTIVLKPDLPVAHKDLGDGLLVLGQTADAADAFRAALRLNPDYAEAAVGLGFCLGMLGQPGEGLAALRRGLKGLAGNDPRRAMVEKQTREYERAAAVERKLPAILKGDIVPADAAERVVLAGLCRGPSRGLYAAATRFYAEAFAAEPKLADDLSAAHRYSAACSAVRAAQGDGDAADLKPAERSALRGKALAWLRADLALWQKRAAAADPASRKAAADMLALWLREPDLAGVRPAARRDGWTPDERATWDQFWADVRTMADEASKALPSPK